MPAYRVPQFRGGLASAAYAWVSGKTLAFEAQLGPLRAGTASGLLENYRVTRQQPAPGTVLRFASESTVDGVAHPITPLIVWGKQA
jgi:hypothetical protein